MAATKIPDDRTMMATLKKMKAYNAYKAKQLQRGGQEPVRTGEALQTVETWAADALDTGEDWAERREADANQRIEEAAYWEQQLKRDEQQAAEESEFRSRLDMEQMKKELKEKLDDYQDAIRQQAKDGHRWAKRQSVQAAQECAEAKAFVDDGLERAMDVSAEKAAQNRRKRKLIAQKMQQRADEGRQWKSEYSDQPGKYPAGQRAEVEAALDELHSWAEEKIADLQTLGGSAASPIESLKGVQNWCNTLKPQVGAQGPALARAKELGASGAAEARAALAQIEAFEAAQERAANDNLELFRRWTDRNNALAKEWVNSDNPKRRQWAEAWLKTQE